jgi:chorismate lyase/3-hydroxybenzoate synthase
MTQNTTEALKMAEEHLGDDRRLTINLGLNTVPVSPDKTLLVGFHFGSDADLSEQDGVVSIGIDPVGCQDLVECWWYQGDVNHQEVGDVRISECADYGIVTIQVPDSSPQDFRESAYEVYRQLLGAVRQSPHQHLAKIWNYFPDINNGDDDQEKYRQFSIGRAEAFEQFGDADAAVPAGTGIGCVRKSNFTVVALTSLHNLLPAENPRQVSAFQYPRQYGPSSPKFSRGGCVPSGSQNLLLYSGTAAIIGHESVHPYDVRLQTAETLENLDHLCEALSGLCNKEANLVLDEKCVLRVYLRNLDDLEYVASELTRSLGTIESNVVFLNADICRRELMIEIDGVRVLS